VAFQLGDQMDGGEGVHEEYSGQAADLHEGRYQ